MRNEVRNEMKSALGGKRLFLFDLGKVLIDFDFNIAIKRLGTFFPSDLTKIYKLFRNSAIADGWDKGAISEGEFYSRVQTELGLKTTLEEFKNIWNEIFEEKKEVINFALSLKETSKIAILSNTNPWHISHIRRKYAWIQEWDDLIASCEVGLLKPDPEIFKLALKRLNFFPDQSLYIDDSPENVSSAKALGIESFLFKDLAGLKQDLKSRGVGLTEEDLSAIRE